MTVTPKPEKLINETLSEQSEQNAQPFSCQNSKAIFLQQAGSLKDDSSLSELRKSIYRARGRSEIENDVSS